jgi:hypothetical protein
MRASLHIPSELPVCLVGLSPELRWLVNDSLSNDEGSSDSEVTTYWVEAGLSVDQAQAAIAYRDQVMIDPLFQLFAEEKCEMQDTRPSP